MEKFAVTQFECRHMKMNNDKCHLVITWTNSGQNRK